MKTVFLLMIFVSSTAHALAFDLEAGVVEISHNRPDLNVEKLWIATACFNQNGSPTNHDCIDVKIGGQPQVEPIEFLASQSEKNRVPTQRISIEYHDNSGKIFCIGMKVLFYGYPNQGDYVLYTDLHDRYSILSFCNIDELPGTLASQPRFSHRRALGWADFATQFAKPITLQLKVLVKNY